MNNLHCRTGSSEILMGQLAKDVHLHCRTGSSETPRSAISGRSSPSLPDRQLRNCGPSGRRVARSSLPDRQLRNLAQAPENDPVSSLPDRQLRKVGLPETPSISLFTAGQAAQKSAPRQRLHGSSFTAGQAAQKINMRGGSLMLDFTAGQAAQKGMYSGTP